jgi:predicted HTH domain antitoxin
MSAEKNRNLTLREAVRLLMLSPFYFKLALAERKILLYEFCSRHSVNLDC